MCCGKAFWKRIIAFCVTFGLGLLVSNLFISKEAAKENPEPTVILAPAESNCVPVDGNLKYERLTAEEKPDLDAKKTEEKKKSLKAAKEKQNKTAEPEPQFYNPSKTDAEYKKLLHREKCFEAQDQK
jgi:hypothetical protein